MTDDELQATIERVEAKRRELAAAVQPAGVAAKILSMLSKAAEAYRRQVIVGLDGHLEATAKARSILRELIGTVTIKAEPDGGVWGEFEAQPAALLRVAERDGRGEAICRVNSEPWRVLVRRQLM